MLTTGPATKPPVDNPLLFIDTNILLDFYRQPISNAGLSLLRRVGDHHAAIITGEQVEMEFKKQRHATIVDAREKMKIPSLDFPIPAFLSGSEEEEALKAYRTQLTEHASTIRAKVEEILREPDRHDPVYEVAEALFRSETLFNLSRQKTQRFAIRQKAENRFKLGYPPRKPGDTSMGDAVNWEWMVECVTTSKRDLVIVSRDTDYGIRSKEGRILNDWLRHEFAERTGGSNRVFLTDRLAEAFELIAVPVSPAEVAEENAMLRRQTAIGRIMLAWGEKWLELSPLQRQLLDTFAAVTSENFPRGSRVAEIAARTEIPESEVRAELQNAMEMIQTTPEPPSTPEPD